MTLNVLENVLSDFYFEFIELDSFLKLFSNYSSFDRNLKNAKKAFIIRKNKEVNFKNIVFHYRYFNTIQNFSEGF